jgi:hypothetical protein
MCPRTIRPMILRHQSTARRRGFDRADMEFAGQLAKASRMTCENVSISALAIYRSSRKQIAQDKRVYSN